MRLGVADVAGLRRAVDAVVLEARESIQTTPTGLFGPGGMLAFSSAASRPRRDPGCSGTAASRRRRHLVIAGGQRIVLAARRHRRKEDEGAVIACVTRSDESSLVT